MLDPLVVLLGEHGADQRGAAGLSGKMPTTSLRRRALADVQRQRIGPDEGVGAGVQAGPATPRPARRALGHPRHLALGQAGDAERIDQLEYPPGRGLVYHA